MSRQLQDPKLPRPLVAFLYVVVATTVTGACAYNYAGQQSKSSPQQEASADPTVVEMESEDEGQASADTGSQNAGSAASGSGGGAANDSGRADTASACGVETFKVHFYDSSTRVTKTIDCAEGQVVSINRSPISQSKLREAQTAGLPENTWYVLVDPKGLRARYLTNEQMIKISNQFDLRFLGRDEERNLLIYEYRDDL